MTECCRLIERPFPVVVSAPSGTGKTVVVERLLAIDGRLVRALTATTRPARKGEVEGVHYLFLSQEEFAAKREAGQFVEFARVHDHWYGVPKASVHEALRKGKWVVCNVDVQGGLAIRQAHQEAVLIFLLPPSMEALEERLRGRGTDSEEEVALRMRNALAEMAVARQYDYVVVNDDIRTCANRLLEIVHAETSRTARGLVMPSEP
ncbi:MAG: guanylate kinase [Candidatus Eisenbacteria bacterium]|uniref:Guanylate kinase n=1 Tax=Eiseniibacteriota bacterium TaxID=2212470 RepID=A0A938BQ97_UNCEI|nr:guanylate kinase [Candidatus Eisenbacteria bacterium]